jgi:hypothetical protein
LMGTARVSVIVNRLGCLSFIFFPPPINADGRRLEVVHNASDFRLRLAKIDQ